MTQRHLFETHRSLGRTYLRPAGCSLCGQSICATLTLPGSSRPTGEGYNNPDEKNTRRTQKGEKGTLEALLGDWRLYNEQRSQVRCCNLYSCASIDRIKIQRLDKCGHLQSVWVRPACEDFCMCVFFGRFHESYRNVLHVKQHCSPPRGPAVAVSKEEASCLSRPPSA